MNRPQVMGIVNVTPDSFSDGGRLATVEAAVAHGLRLVAQGADSLDIGGESTRPGAAPVNAAEELARVLPVITGLRAHWAGPISIDTMKPEVARAAVAAGATIWNDVTALGGAPDSAAVAAELGCTVVLMHMRGEPRTMQADPRYDDVLAEVTGWLTDRAAAAMAAGVARERIWLDPGLRLRQDGGAQSGPDGRSGPAGRDRVSGAVRGQSQADDPGDGFPRPRTPGTGWAGRWRWRWRRRGAARR